MALEATKTCPNCDAEYYARVQMCADCQIPLQWTKSPSHENGATPLTETGWDQFENGEILGQVTSDLEKIIDEYIKEFKRSGIRSAVLPLTRFVTKDMAVAQSIPFPSAVVDGQSGEIPVGDLVEGYQFILFVRQLDHEAASRIIEENFVRLHPGQENGFHLEFEADQCPACGFALPEAMNECPDCGLMFSE